MAGHGRQEIVGTTLYYANYTSHIISHYGIICQNIIYNTGRQAGRLYLVITFVAECITDINYPPVQPRPDTITKREIVKSKRSQQTAKLSIYPGDIKG